MVEAANDVSMNGGSITAYVSIVAALIAAIVSVYNTFIIRKNNKETLKLQRELGYENIEANVISKARIEWIQKAREATVEFISECSECLKFKQELQTDYYDTEKQKKIKISEMNVLRSANLLILYFGDDFGENDDIVNQIISLKNNILIEHDTIKSFIEFDFNIFNADIESLRDLLRTYFKKEWLKVSKVKAFDDKNELKRNIQEIKEYLFEKKASLGDMKRIVSNINFKKRFHEHWISKNKKDLEHNKKTLLILLLPIIFGFIISIALFIVHKYQYFVITILVFVIIFSIFMYYLIKNYYLIKKRYKMRVEIVKEFEMILDFINNTIQTLEKPKADK